VTLVGALVAIDDDAFETGLRLFVEGIQSANTPA
jgi:hypothetical protein